MEFKLRKILLLLRQQTRSSLTPHHVLYLHGVVWSGCVGWVGIFELNSLAVFDRALTVVRQMKYRSRPTWWPEQVTQSLRINPMTWPLPRRQPFSQQAHLSWFL